MDCQLTTSSRFRNVPLQCSSNFRNPLNRLELIPIGKLSSTVFLQLSWDDDKLPEQKY